MLVKLEEGKRLPYKPTITPDMLPYLRTARGLKQSEFAMLIGITQSTLSRIELGVIPISDNTLKAIRGGIAKLRISGEEIEYIKRMIEIKKQRGYR